MFILKPFKISLILLLLIQILMSVAYGDTEYKVKSTDSLSRIVDRFYKESNLSRDQIYIGILAENPQAFNLGNINYLKNGRVLGLPSEDALLVMEEVDARSLVLEHNNLAKKGNKAPIPAPFKNYTPKKDSSVNTLAEKQQTASEKLEALDSETEELRIRLEKLISDKQAMDAELDQLNGLLKK